MSLARNWTEDIKLGKLLDSSKPTLCLCKVGQRSYRLASFLIQEGFEEVYNIEGGINSYSGIFIIY